MAQQALEQRVTELEKQVRELQQRMRSGSPDWRNAVGMFTDRPEMLEILADAVKAREADRKRTRPARPPRRRSAS